MRRENNKPENPRRYVHRRPTFSAKLFLSIAGFMAVLLALLWVFQVLLLDRFYYRVTLRDMEKAALQLDGVQESDLDRYTAAIAAHYDFCTIVTDASGKILSSSSDQPVSVIGHLSDDTFRSLRAKAGEAGGSYAYTFSYEDIAVPSAGDGASSVDTAPVFPLLPEEKDDNGRSDGIRLPRPDTSGESSGASSGKKDHGSDPFRARNLRRLVYVRLLRNEDEAERVVLLDCALTPVDTVGRTITIQLTIVTAICILGTLILTFFLSRHISRPLSDISRSAGELAAGNYQVTFRGGGCREIDELSDTLSYAGSELSKLKELQNGLIANISHDLRTPLTMISGYAEVMRDLPGENTPENAQIIIDETNRLRDLVNNLLEVSRAGEEAGKLTPEVFSLSDILQETVDRFRKLNECRGYTFLYKEDGKADIYADRQKMLQVLYNLIGNAINYTGNDKLVTVVLTVGSGIVRVDVKDTGDGIPAEKLPHIWDRYYRGDDFHKRSVVGVGLGLSIVKDILDAHGAAYGVTSEQGAGSDFWFKLHTVNDTTAR